MKYLIVVAHPDDEILGMGGTLYQLSKDSNNDITICYMSSEAAARRKKDIDLNNSIKNSLKELNINPKFIYGQFPNIKFNTVPHLDLVKFVEEAILETSPNIVITHYQKDLNDDHKKTSEACQVAIRIFQRMGIEDPITELRYIEILSSTDWSLDTPFKPNYYFEIGEEGINKKINALSNYNGVIRSFPHPRSVENIKALSMYRGSMSNLRYAEAFEIVYKREKI